VFNDGIAGYPEPYYDKRIESSFVLDHPNTKSLKCLSTNCVYYGAYCALAKMAALTGDPGAIHDYEKKAICLKRNILRNLSDKNHLYYFIDGSGRPDLSQEGLGLSFALIFGIIDGSRAHQLIQDAHVSEFGLTSIYPDYPYFSREKPGRHNNIVWPMVNGFFARAARISGNEGIFTKELFNLAHLATDPDKGNNDFREIYNPYTGRPDGGWQLGSHWNSCHHQTWSATAFISMVHYGRQVSGYMMTGCPLSPFFLKGSVLLRSQTSVTNKQSLQSP
jgi:GH15 family glucan-1,4-alpha-glucosidase